jgi:N-formylglutamate deformylase
MTAVVLHIPHASRHIPAEAREDLLHDEALRRELVRMTDVWTDKLVDGFRLPAFRVVAPVSRLVVDVERFPDDAEEPMARHGMGAVYQRMSTGEPLRDLDLAGRERLLDRWYRPHHARLTEALDGALADQGRCLVIDVHSFAARPLPHEPDQDPERPEVCLGTDPFHTPFRTNGRHWRPAGPRGLRPS